MKTQSLMLKAELFKPFLVQSELKGGNIFQVVELQKEVTRKQIETLLSRLPITFNLKQEYLEESYHLNEPLEVCVRGALIYIYPPKHRVIACTTFDSWRSADVVGKMHIDNVMDIVHPDNGQIRTCVHFDPAIFGIKAWPGTDSKCELELDIHVYPKQKVKESKLGAFHFDKFRLQELLNLIAGGERKLTLKQLEKWRDLIEYAVETMRQSYENPDCPKDNPTRVYYKDCWEGIDAAGEDEEKLIEALESLRSAIRFD